jgi:NAD(P)-dependent dehydrogenase (short-subunit alcohol dehydrogenase family)
MRAISKEVEMKLSNQTVVIVGGSSGIGLSVAQNAIQEGANVIIASRSEQRVKSAIDKISSNVKGYTVDVTQEDTIQNLFAQIGQFDHLVMTPGESLSFKTFLEEDIAHARRTFESKFWGQYLCSRYAAPYIHERGSITFMSGSGGMAQGLTTAGAVNGAVEFLMRYLAIDLAPIRVNVVRPGLIDTGLWEYLADSERSQMYETVGKSSWLKRIGQPEDVAQSYLYLMTNQFTTGSAVTLNGGV